MSELPTMKSFIYVEGQGMFICPLTNIVCPANIDGSPDFDTQHDLEDLEWADEKERENFFCQVNSAIFSFKWSLKPYEKDFIEKCYLGRR